MTERVQISKAASTVTVACKVPNGMFLQLYKMGKEVEATPTGHRDVPKAIKVGEPIKLNGCALRFGETAEFPMPGGYALTQVPSDFWEAWLEQNQDSDAVRNRVIFASDSQDKTSARAREQHKEGVKSGMEPINPRDPPKVGTAKITPVAAPQ